MSFNPPQGQSAGYIYEFSYPTIEGCAPAAAGPPEFPGGYVYDDDHYVVRYCILRYAYVGNALFVGQAQCHEFYCYGSESSFITSFGPPSAGNEILLAHIPSGASGLFKQSIAVGYAKWANYASSYDKFAVFLPLSEAVKNHTLNSGGNRGLSSSNYRSYVHSEDSPYRGQITSPLGTVGYPRMDGWHNNAIITKAVDINYQSGSEDVGSATITDQGATANHLAILEALPFNGFQPSHSRWDIQEINIYPIKKV